MSDFSVRYLSNSGFVLETSQYLFIFDDEGAVKDVYGKEDFAGKRAVFFAASHSHGDHFSPHIFSYAACPNVHYILSYEIPVQHEKAVHLSVGESVTVEGVRFIATDSTDLGISLTMEFDGHRIFHAGDLNDWHWKDYSTPAEAAAMEAMYLAVLPTIPHPIDLAFVPVDPRLGTDYDRGAELFLEAFSPKMLVPMHFRESVQAPLDFARKYAEHPTQIITLTRSGEVYGGTL